MSEDAQIHYASDIVVRVRHNAAVRVEMSEQGPQGPAGDITDEMRQALADAREAQAEAEAAETGAKVAEQGAAAQRQGAETAQGLAEAARAGANIERLASETSRQASEVARQGSETARTGAQTARTGAEAARTGAETALGATNTARDQAIVAKDQAVSEKTAAQTARAGAETAQGLAAQNELATAALRDEVLEALDDTETARDLTFGARDLTFGARDVAQAAAQSSIDTAAVSLTVQPTQPAGTNLNTLKTKGIYLFATAANVTSALNFPVANRTGRLVVMASGAKVIQEYTDDQAVNGWMRVTADGTTWSAWANIWNSATLSTPAQAEAEAGSATTPRIWTSQRVRQNVAAYASPLGHKHVAADITDLQALLNAKSNNGHQHPVSDVTGLQTALDAKAPLASPALTGTPTAPTAAAGTNSNQLATTAFVKAAIDTLAGAAPGVLDTLDEIAAALGDDPNFAATMTAQLAGKAALVHTHDAADINTGVLNDDRLPVRLGPISRWIADWNDVRQNGYFMAPGAVNAPTPTEWYVGHVVVHNDAWVTQTVWGFSNNSNADTKTYRRELDNGVWTAWERVWQTESELDARYAKLAGAIFQSVVETSGPNAMLAFRHRDDASRMNGWYTYGDHVRLWDSVAGDLVTIPTDDGEIRFRGSKIWNDENTKSFLLDYRKAHLVMGGGTISVSPTGRIKWSERFIEIANGSASWADIFMPAVGAAISCTDGTTVTVEADGIPLENWAALWFDATNAILRIIRHSAGPIIPPSSWIPICHQNGENGTFYFPRGIQLKGGESFNTAGPGLQKQITDLTNNAILIDGQAAKLPAGPTSGRPAAPLAGYIRFNETSGKFEGYGSAWGNIGGGAAISDTPPVNPASGDLWWHSGLGVLLVRYDDGTSAQWVAASPTQDPNLFILRGNNLSDLTDKVAARANLGVPANPFKNVLINALGMINQRGYISGAATGAAGQYTVDRWRVVASGQALTWTDSENVRTFVAPAGGVEQVVEGLNLQSGAYRLSWTGTATATVDGVAVANGGSVNLVGGVATTVRFTGGTFSKPQLELGSVVTEFGFLPIDVELPRCQRYFETGNGSVIGYGGSIGVFTSFAVTKRIAPVIAHTIQSFQNFTFSANDLISSSGFRLWGNGVTAGNVIVNFIWTATAEF